MPNGQLEKEGEIGWFLNLSRREFSDRRGALPLRAFLASCLDQYELNGLLRVGQRQEQYSAEEKIRIVLDGLRGEDSIAELCRCEGISQGVYYKWSKDFMEAGKKRLAGDTARAATTDEVKELRREARDLKEVVAEQMLELRLLKKA